MCARAFQCVLDSLDFFDPREFVRTFPWAEEHICDYAGDPYSADNYPHLSAPNGPFDAFDDPAIRTIWLMFGSRLGKTFFGQSCLIKSAACDPGPMMFATQSEKLAKEVTGRTYGMLEKCAPLKGFLRPAHKRTREFMELGEACVYVAWARSVSTLADKAARIGHAAEIDKWEHPKTAKEADPLSLYTERFKQHRNAKIILEGTPTIHGESRVEDGFLTSDQRRLYVPCPHCGEFQVLEMGDGTGAGVRWDKVNGRSTPDLAYRTARYVCAFCEKDILNHHRGDMMRRGVWLLDGQQIGTDGAITGLPKSPGRDAGFHLSSLYSLQLDWSEVASEAVKSLPHPAKMRNFVNSWEARTWKTSKRQSEPEEVGERLRGKHKQGVVPIGATWLTIGVDKQRAEGGFLVYVVLAHGPEDRTWIIDYGRVPTFASLYGAVIQRQYAHEDGRWAIKASLTLVDSGDDTATVYKFMREHPKEGILPCKGKDVRGGIHSFEYAVLGENGEKNQRAAAKEHAGNVLIHVPTDYTEEALQRLLTYGVPGEPNSLSLCEEASQDFNFLEQLCNGAMTEKEDERHILRSLWVRKDKNQPNDYRDAMRYGFTARDSFIVAKKGLAPKREAPPAPVVIQQDQRRGRMNLQRR